MAEKWNIFLDVDGVLNREQDWVRPWIKRRIVCDTINMDRKIV